MREPACTPSLLPSFCLRPPPSSLPSSSVAYFPVSRAHWVSRGRLFDILLRNHHRLNCTRASAHVSRAHGFPCRNRRLPRYHLTTPFAPGNAIPILAYTRFRNANASRKLHKQHPLHRYTPRTIAITSHYAPDSATYDCPSRKDETTADESTLASSLPSPGSSGVHHVNAVLVQPGAIQQ
jgi:hypothetical protein